MRVIIAGGGTAGHINPGIAIAKYIKQKHPDAQILFIGTKNGLEGNLVPREGFEIQYIQVFGFKRKLSFSNIRVLKDLFFSLIESKKILKRVCPDIVIGTGGYVCGPILFMASQMKIPTLIHEQNAFPGITNRILSLFVESVAISFKESKKYFSSAKKLSITGNPIRNEIVHYEKKEARQTLEMSLDKPLVTVFGGSRGAERINQSVIDMIKNNYHSEDYNIIFACGDNHYEKTKKQLDGLLSDTVKLVPYIYNMGEIMAASDLMVCRGGAITISELTAMGIPSIIIPSPNVTANHQEYNARALEEQGAAVVIIEKNLSGELLGSQITSLLKDSEQLGKMSRNAKKNGIHNATDKIYSLMKELIKPALSHE